MAFPEDSEHCPMFVELVKLLPDAEYYIQIIVKELKRDIMTNWWNIRDVLRQLYQRHFDGIATGRCFECDDLSSSPFLGYSPISTCRKNFENFILRIFKLFDMHKYCDKPLNAAVLEILCFTIFAKYSHSYEDNYEKWMRSRLNESNGNTSIFIHEKNIGMPSLVPQISESKCVPPNWVTMLACDGEVDVLKVAISYGETLIVPQKGIFEWIKFYFIGFLHMKTNYNKTLMEECFFTYRFEKNWMKLNEHSRMRIYVVCIVLDILYKGDIYARTDKYVQCAKILINSTQEPLITSDEIKSLFTEFFSWIFLNDQILQLLEAYESHFPGSREASTPRSLKHLSRIQVRACLKTAGLLPHRVDSLCIPKKIQDYIRLKDIYQ